MLYNLGHEGTVNVERHFQDEFLLLRELENPNIILPFHKFVSSFSPSALPDWTAERDAVMDHTLFIVMELLPVTLHSFIRRRSEQRADQDSAIVSRAEFITIATGVLDALAFLHDKFIVHRDVKAGLKNFSLRNKSNNNNYY